MDEVRKLLEAIRQAEILPGHIRGFFHLLIGRTIRTVDGQLVSNGVTWRELANQLKALRFEPELIAELDIDPDTIAPRDRERLWYTAIGVAKPDSALAVQQGERLVPKLKALGYVVGPPPGGLPAVPVTEPTKQIKPDDATEKAVKKPKKKS